MFHQFLFILVITFIIFILVKTIRNNLFRPGVHILWTGGRGGRTSFKSHVTSAFQYCARTTIAGSLGSIIVALVSSRSMHYVWKE